jgi:trimethylamine---corrinoid protein Co-methyltransferase
MGPFRIEVLTGKEIGIIHDATLKILAETGVKVHHDEILKLLGQAGAKVDGDMKIARMPERLVMDSIACAGKQYTLYGRDGTRQTRFGFGEPSLMSSPGQYRWIDTDSGLRRAARVSDVGEAIRLGDALEHIGVVGSMAQPEEIDEAWRDVYLTGELIKGTTKPTRRWVKNGRNAEYILEMYRAAAGGAEALRKRPRVEAFLEPISPLQLPGHGLEILRLFAQAGQPVSVGPMAMTGGTAPATLAGTLAQENAEILAGVVVTQTIAPGTAMMYGGIPHIMDPSTGICSFGSPEQALMGSAMVQMARHYGFPCYINVGLTDSKLLDAQAGIEKGTSLLMGLLAGADTFGHAGICGTDHAGGLAWLMLDNELMAYAKRIARGIGVSREATATEVVAAVGPAGNFLEQEHTALHFRSELFLPGAAWTRQSWDGWESQGRSSMGERLVAEVKRILAMHTPTVADEKLARELDRIVKTARESLG